MELKDIDLKESLGMRFDGSLNLIVRVSVEGQVRRKATRIMQPLKCFAWGGAPNMPC